MARPNIILLDRKNWIFGVGALENLKKKTIS